MYLQGYSLRIGSINKQNSMATTRSARLIKIDSLKNCPINWTRLVPRAFRLPASRARSIDLTVARFMKLMQASVAFDTLGIVKTTGARDAISQITWP